MHAACRRTLGRLGREHVVALEAGAGIRRRRERDVRAGATVATHTAAAAAVPRCDGAACALPGPDTWTRSCTVTDQDIRPGQLRRTRTDIQLASGFPTGTR